MKRLCILVAIELGLLGLVPEPAVNGQAQQSQTESDAGLANGPTTDSDTELEFRKVCGITGSRDVIKWGGVQMSPNGKFLLFDNYVVPIEEGDPIQLAVDLPGYRSSWSPDGNMVAFYSDGIWVIPVSPETGRAVGPARELVDGSHTVKGLNVQWSPDSEKILYLSANLHFSVVSVKDGSRTQITRESQRRFPGGWSPDGDWIVYPSDRHICLLPAKGGKPRNLAEAKGSVSALDWSADGKWVFYERNRQLHFIRVSDALALEIPLPEEIGKYVSWSPDGTKMFFYKPSYEGTDTLRIVHSSGGEPFGPRRLKLSSYGQYWSPDSKFVLTWGEHDQKWIYWIIPLTGDVPFPLQLHASMDGTLAQESLSHNVRNLLFSRQRAGGQKEYWVTPVSVRAGKTVGIPMKVFDKGTVKSVRWTPDGSKLAFLYQEDLWFARTDGSPAVRVTRPSDRNVVRHMWSPDASAISWISHNPSSGKSILRVRRLSEDEPRDVAKTSEWISYRWSPYGSRIAYEFFERENDAMRQLLVAPASGGESKKLTETKQEGRGRFQYAWSPSGEKIAVLADRKLLLFRLPDGQCRQVGGAIDIPFGGYSNMAWSPNGRRLALIMWAKDASSVQEESGSRIFTVTVPEGKWAQLVGESGANNYFLYWSPDGEWISYDSEESVKTRPEGILWEVSIAEHLKKMAEANTLSASPSAD